MTNTNAMNSANTAVLQVPESKQYEATQELTKDIVLDIQELNFHYSKGYVPLNCCYTVCRSS